MGTRAFEIVARVEGGSVQDTSSTPDQLQQIIENWITVGYWNAAEIIAE